MLEASGIEPAYLVGYPTSGPADFCYQDDLFFLDATESNE